MSVTGNRTPRKAGAFDIRTFIASLIGLYGVVLVLMGLLGTSDADLRRAGGLNINLWAGAGLVVGAAAFQVWAMLRPVIVPDDFTAEEEATAATGEAREPAGR